MFIQLRMMRHSGHELQLIESDICSDSVLVGSSGFEGYFRLKHDGLEGFGGFAIVMWKGWVELLFFFLVL